MPAPREEVLYLVNTLASLRTPNLHICVTSRPEIVDYISSSIGHEDAEMAQGGWEACH
jgi:hypothetical protein